MVKNVFIKNSNTIEIQQREGAITSGQDEKYVLATYALKVCIGVLGYNREEKLGFLMHADVLTDIKQSIIDFDSIIAQGSRDRSLDFEIYLFGLRDATIEKVESVFPLQIESRKYSVVKKDHQSSCALDTKTGQIGCYYSYKRRQDFLSFLLDSFRLIEPTKVKIIYSSDFPKYRKQATV